MRKVLIAGMLANGLEWYDYALYAFTTLIISKQFFPEGDDSVHLLATLGIFAVGFVARPFGGVFFGVIGDKFGRRKALMLSIFLMAVPTGCIGLLPTYEHVGIWAPLLLTFIRVLQGLSLGGAFSGSMTFLVEHAPEGRRGLMGSTSIISLILGFLFGSIVCMAIQVPLSETQYESWGWRIPFILGIPISLVGLYIRNHTEESATYTEAKQSGGLSATPVREVFASQKIHMLQAVGIYVTVTMPFYLLAAYFITFTEHTLLRSHNDALMLNFSNMVIALVLAPFGAWLSDIYGRRLVLGLTAIGFLIVAYPMFYLMLHGDFMQILLGQTLFAICVGFYIGPVPALLVEIFPTRIRYTGMSLSYNFAAAAFGGTAPMICHWLIDATHNVYSISAYVVVCALVSLVSLYFYKERFRDNL